jgi:hypothetical protein
VSPLPARLLPLALLFVFCLVEAAANWRVIRAHTVSEVVWSLGWPGRVVAALLLAVLFGHLVLRWPYGPDA